MADKFELKQTKQCETCPWRVSADPYDIPNYNRELHLELDNTISNPNPTPQEIINTVSNNDPKLSAMSCHYFTPEDEVYCVGWMYNQLGSGNNIRLRMEMMNCSNINQLTILGEQHCSFEHTIPQESL